jgi:hypothetical protein
MDGPPIITVRGHPSTLSPLSAAQDSSGIFSLARYCPSDGLGFREPSFRSLIGFLCFGVFLAVVLLRILRTCREPHSHRGSYPPNCDLEKHRRDISASADAAHLVENETRVKFLSERSAHSPHLQEPKRGISVGTMITRISWGLACLLFGLYPFALALEGRSELVRRQAQQANSSAALVDFQVYKPVEFDPGSPSCNAVLLLMEHQFAFSYGQPFVGEDKK